MKPSDFFLKWADTMQDKGTDSDVFKLRQVPFPASFHLGPVFSSCAAVGYAWLTSAQPYTEIFCPNTQKANHLAKPESTIRYKTSVRLIL